MQKEIRDVFRVQYKWIVLQYAKVCRTDANAYRDFDVPKSTFYGWKRAFNREGKAGLERKKSMAHNHPRNLKQDVIVQILSRCQSIMG